MAKRERKILSMKERVDLIKLQQSTRLRQRDLIEQFCIGKTQVQVILKSQAEFLDIFLEIDSHAPAIEQIHHDWENQLFDDFRASREDATVNKSRVPTRIPFQNSLTFP